MGLCAKVEISRKNRVSNNNIDNKDRNTLKDNINQKVWNVTTISEVVQQLYGLEAKKQIEKYETGNKVQLRCTKYGEAESPWSEEQCLSSLNFKIGIKVFSSKKLDSVAVLYTGNKFPLMFFAKFSKYSRLPIVVKMRFYQDGTLMLIAKDKNGKLYISKSYFLNTRRANDMDSGTSLDFYIQYNKEDK